MQTRSSADTTLFSYSLILFSFFALLFSVPFWGIKNFDNITSLSVRHITIGLGYIAFFLALPVWAISRTRRIFVISKGEIKVIEWFGLKKRTYLLPERNTIKMKNEVLPHRVRFFPLSNKYYDFKTLYFTTREGRKLRIQSRYYKNFDSLHIAIRKACS